MKHEQHHDPAGRLARHIQEQQDRACKLAGVIEGLAFIDNEVGRNGAVTALLMVAAEIAGDLSSGLDAMNLPLGDAA